MKRSDVVAVSVNKLEMKSGLHRASCEPNLRGIPNIFLEISLCRGIPLAVGDIGVGLPLGPACASFGLYSVLDVSLALLVAAAIAGAFRDGSEYL